MFSPPHQQGHKHGTCSPDRIKYIPRDFIDDDLVKTADTEKGKPTSGFPFIRTKSDDVAERKILLQYLQPGGVRTRLSIEEKQEFLTKVSNLSKHAIAEVLNTALYDQDKSIVTKAANFTEALVETNNQTYIELFSWSLNKFKELKASVAFKPVHTQIGKILSRLTKDKESSMKATKPVINDIDVWEDPEVISKSLPGEPKEPNIFANLNLKAPKEKLKEKSAFKFIAQPETKTALQDLDLDFTAVTQSAAKPSDLLDIGTAFELSRPSSHVATGTVNALPMFGSKAQSESFRESNVQLIPLPIFAKDESGEGKAIDKYFDFINAEL